MSSSSVLYFIIEKLVDNQWDLCVWESLFPEIEYRSVMHIAFPDHHLVRHSRVLQTNLSTRKPIQVVLPEEYGDITIKHPIKPNLPFVRQMHSHTSAYKFEAAKYQTIPTIRFNLSDNTFSDNSYAKRYMQLHGLSYLPMRCMVLMTQASVLAFQHWHW